MTLNPERPTAAARFGAGDQHSNRCMIQATDSALEVALDLVATMRQGIVSVFPGLFVSRFAQLVVERLVYLLD
ncbi:hypothetical protein RM530_04525 [Algiphilus sp. W345]|uniref:Uncharacterized protein n=1 Tax=Banduia mediterranea TaxID=3075609 RepID=A0ABU2WFH8_9GAMM|nr:hypothetical protein [Algiphilus sp. W345]MDT0496626.1 hypothetical protein [Algiphilus sp. W345]